MIEILGVSKRYGRKQVLDGLDWRITEGKVIGLYGLNGAGKSTLLKMLAGILTPDKGTVRIDGLPTGNESKRLVAYVPDADGFYPWMRVRELLQFMADFYPGWDQRVAVELLASFRIELSAVLGQLSRGTLAKVKLILGFAQQAKYLLLDEPMLGIDPLSRKELLKLLVSEMKEDGQTVVMATHDVHEVETLFDEVAFLANGKIVREASPEILRESHGMPVIHWLEEVAAHARI